MSKVAEAEVCAHCGQPIGSGVGGEYPCPRCGTPTLHDPAPTPEERDAAQSLTPEQRAASCMEWLKLPNADLTHLRNMQGEIAAQIREADTLGREEAAAAEREACAVLLEKLAPAYGRFDRNIAEALKDAAREVRARSEP